MTPKSIKKAPLPEVTVIGKKEKPSLTKTYKWTGESLNDAISEVNTFILNKGNFGMGEKADMKALMKKAEGMLKQGAFGNLDNLLEKELTAYKPGRFGQSRFKGYTEVAPSKVKDGKLVQVEGEEAKTIGRIRSTRPNAGMKPGKYTIQR